MNVGEARSSLLDVLLGSTGVFSVSRQDRVLRFALQEALRRTRADRKKASHTLTADQATVDITSTDSEFASERFIHAEIDYWPVRTRDYRWVANRQINNTTTSNLNQSRCIGWMTSSDGLMWPTPGSADTLDVWFWRPLNMWTVGSETAPTLATEINVPDEWIDTAIRMGAAPALVDNAPNHVIAHSAWWRDYLVWLDDIRGENNPDIGASEIGTSEDYWLNYDVVTDPA